MDQINQLITLILTWRTLIQTKEARYQTLSDPIARIRPALELIDLRMELSLMEDELCDHLHIPSHLYECKPQDPHQA